MFKNKSKSVINHSNGVFFQFPYFLLKMEIKENIKQPKSVRQNGLITLLNEEDQTAGVIGNDSSSGDIFIPKSVKYENQEFVVKKIMRKSLNNSDSINSVQFASDSDFNIIENEAFSNSSIKSITIQLIL